MLDKIQYYYRSGVLIDLQDKFTEVIVTDKVQYDARFKTYKGKTIFTFFHKIDNDEAMAITINQKNKLEYLKSTIMTTVKLRYWSDYARVVLLMVHVNVVGEELVEKLCPMGEKVPLSKEFPFMYYEDHARFTEVIVTDKAEYVQRYEIYKSKIIYTLFHKINKDEVEEYNSYKFNKLEFLKSCTLNSLKKQYKLPYSSVVLLVVHVDVVGEEFIENLCPIDKAPLSYPRMYYEEYEKFTEVIVTSHAEYVQRSETYKGKIMYTLFHNIKDNDVEEFNSRKYNKLQLLISRKMCWLRRKHMNEYTSVVLLVVHVDVAGEAIDNLCPIKPKPFHYPRMYYEDNKEIKVFGGYGPNDESEVVC
ncbi:uncharacterized protein LOC128995781 [Macrosteles quadrilineatus]|uniref:uncharacterized protein LOC128995781 n=1 Tax=Macrosteles quadrilineatus TaxID=74068 RepID=UPI0023E15021|nr:uncharacterized protein LOC128995781 [Macrosteles quadrilineatus]